MKPGRVLLQAGDGFLDRILCVAGALVFSQAPEFAQQYLQRLGGHVDEAKRIVKQYQETAAQSGLSLDTFIARTNANADAAVAKLGGVMSSAVARVQELEASQGAIQNASVWTRPFMLVRHGDPEIAEATWQIFKPALPITGEGLLYAIIGMLLLLIVYRGLIWYPVTRIARARSNRNGAEGARLETLEKRR